MIRLRLLRILILGHGCGRIEHYPGEVVTVPVERAMEYCLRGWAVEVQEHAA